MQFLVAGLSQHNTPFKRLERLVVNQDELPAILEQASHYLGEVVVLSTCHRTEIYTVSDNDDNCEPRLREFLDQLDIRSGRSGPPINSLIYSFCGDETVRHIFRVTSGLDSMVIGEPEIVGQVAAALRSAGEASTVSRGLSRLFHHALRVSRKVRSHTDIGRNSLSISTIGVRLLKKTLGGLANISILVVGTGQTGQLAVRELKKAGAERVLLASRRTERAIEVADDLEVTPIPLSNVEDTLSNYDVLVTCTAAPGTIITSSMVHSAMVTRKNKPMFILDLALPADVDTDSGKIPSVTLFGLSDLSEIAAQHHAKRKDAAQKAEAMVNSEVSHFREIVTGDSAEPLIKSLVERAEKTRSHEVQRALKNMPGLNEDGVEVLEAMSRAIVKRILADPITFLKAGINIETTATVAKAFDIDLVKPTDSPPN